MVGGVHRDESGGGSFQNVKNQGKPGQSYRVPCSSSVLSFSSVGENREYQVLAPKAFLTSPPGQYPGSCGGQGDQLSEHHHHNVGQQQSGNSSTLQHDNFSRHRDDELGVFRPQTVRPGRRGPPPGPGFNHRTLSSSSLLSGKMQVAKSRSEYAGINQVCYSGSNYDLLQGQNANLNPNIRNHLSRSGNIVYRGGGLNLPGISFVDSGILLYDKETARELLSGFRLPAGAGGSNSSGPAVGTGKSVLAGSASTSSAPSPPDRRYLVRGLSRNAFVNIPSHHLEQQPQHQHYYWQQHQQNQTSYTLSNSCEHQHQLHNSQQQFVTKRDLPRVGGSFPDISTSSGPVYVAPTPLPPPVHHHHQQQIPSSHQVSINIPSSPSKSRRLLPRINKKTDSSKVHGPSGEPQSQHFYPRSATKFLMSSSPSSLRGGEDTPSSSSSPSRFDSYISADRRTPDNAQYLKDSTGVFPSPVKKTEPIGLSKKDTSIIIPFSSCEPIPGPSSLHSATASSSAFVTVSTKPLALANPTVCIQIEDDESPLNQANGPPCKLSSSLQPFVRNAPITILQHPLEENIFSSLFITLFAVGVAFVIGVPILCATGVVLVGAVTIRYGIATFHGCAAYTRFFCSNRQHPSRSTPPNIFPRDRLAFGNDVRWLGTKKPTQCQSILTTLVVFEGSMDVATFRNLIQTRVLRAETPEGEMAYPRLLQKLVSVWGGYIWELDLAFDIQNHVYKGPTHFRTEDQFQHYMGKLLTQSLTMTQPLWEIRLVPSYYGQGKDTMAIVRVHQCLADGMSLIRILGHALADNTQMHIPQRPHFAGLSFSFNVIRALIVGPVTIFMWLFTLFRDRNLLTMPLSKLRKKRRSKMFQRWKRLWRRSRGAPPDDENVECPNVAYCNRSSSSSAGDISTFGSESSFSACPALSSYNSTVNRTKVVQALTIPVYTPRKKPSTEVATGTSGTNPVPSPTTPSSTIVTAGGSQPDGEKASLPKPKTLIGGVFGRGESSNVKGAGSSPCNPNKSSAGNDLIGGNDGNPKKSQKKKKKKRKKKRKRVLGITFSKGPKGSKRKQSLESSSSKTFSSLSLSPSHWNVAWSAPMGVAKVGRIKQVMRSAYNDVLLSACAGSVRSYLKYLGTPCPGDMQVVIPVDLRNDISCPKQSSRLGSKVASIVTKVPLGTDAAIPRLWATRHRMDELKSSADSVVAYGATSILMNILPQSLAIPILESVTNKASFQFCNLPGPTSTIVIGGYPVKGIYPIFPPPGRVRAAISVFTYADQVHITVATHRSLIKAGPKLLRGITNEIDQLASQLSHRRVPGESRRSNRTTQPPNPEITKPPCKQIQPQLQTAQEEVAEVILKLSNKKRKLSTILQPNRPVANTMKESVEPEKENPVEKEPAVTSNVDYVNQPENNPPSPSIQVQEVTKIPTLPSNFKTRLKTLRGEFLGLLGEIRRRTSLIEGVQVSFEDDEDGEEYRKPRNRALSVVSMTRRSSIFSARSNTTPESPAYSSDDEMPSSPQPDKQYDSGPYPGPSSAAIAGPSSAVYPSPSSAAIAGPSGGPYLGPSSANIAGPANAGLSSGGCPGSISCTSSSSSSSPCTSSSNRHSSSPMRTTAV